MESSNYVDSSKGRLINIGPTTIENNSSKKVRVKSDLKNEHILENERSILEIPQLISDEECDEDLIPEKFKLKMKRNLDYKLAIKNENK